MDLAAQQRHPGRARRAEQLLEHASTRPDAGAAGARILDLDPPHAIQTWGGGRIAWWRGSSRHFTAETADEKLDYITGASILLRAAALRETGLFDPRFFLYWEDVDLCRRLRARGWKLTVAADAVVYHRLSGTTVAASANKDQLINASAVHFFRKHAPLGGWPAIVIGTTARIARRLIHGNLDAARAVWRGVVSGFRVRLLRFTQQPCECGTNPQLQSLLRISEVRTRKP